MQRGNRSIIGAARTRRTEYLDVVEVGRVEAMGTRSTSTSRGRAERSRRRK